MAKLGIYDHATEKKKKKKEKEKKKLELQTLHFNYIITWMQLVNQMGLTLEFED